jgi:hypothetical protein
MAFDRKSSCASSASGGSLLATELAVERPLEKFDLGPGLGRPSPGSPPRALGLEGMGAATRPLSSGHCRAGPAPERLAVKHHAARVPP